MNIFNNEESILINGICMNEKLSTLTKEDAVNSLAFSRRIADDNDTMLIGLIDSTIEKVRSMTESQWDSLKMKTPLPVALVAEDDVSEVPEDEGETE